MKVSKNGMIIILMLVSCIIAACQETASSKQKKQNIVACNVVVRSGENTTSCIGRIDKLGNIYRVIFRFHSPVRKIWAVYFNQPPKEIHINSKGKCLYAIYTKHNKFHDVYTEIVEGGARYVLRYRYTEDKDWQEEKAFEDVLMLESASVSEIDYKGPIVAKTETPVFLDRWIRYYPIVILDDEGRMTSCLGQDTGSNVAFRYYSKKDEKYLTEKEVRMLIKEEHVSDKPRLTDYSESEFSEKDIVWFQHGKKSYIDYGRIEEEYLKKYKRLYVRTEKVSKIYLTYITARSNGAQVVFDY